MPPMLEHVLICDDIRQEVGNKLSLIGLYGSGLYLDPETKFPGVMDRLSILMRWKGIQGGEKVYIGLKYKDEVLYKPDRPIEVSKPQIESDYSHVCVRLAGFPLKGFGNYVFSIYLNSLDKPFKEASFRVAPRPSSTAD